MGYWINMLHEPSIRNQRRVYSFEQSRKMFVPFTLHQNDEDVDDGGLRGQGKTTEDGLAVLPWML